MRLPAIKPELQPVNGQSSQSVLRVRTWWRALLRAPLTSSYRFIHGPIQRTTQAWQDFARELPPAEAPDLSVNFVPANEGCFLVVQAKEPARGLSALLHGATTSRHPDAILDSFCSTLPGS